MPLDRSNLILYAAVMVVLLAGSAAHAEGPPAWLPRYDLDIDLDTTNKRAQVVLRATWINHYVRPVRELVFNAHSRYIVPEKDVGLTAKMLEILRMQPGEVLGEKEPACDIQRITLVPTTVQMGEPAPAVKLAFRYEGDTKTALVVALPQAVKPGESVTVQLDIVMKLPEKQGRWGQWRNVTFLSNWLPVFAVYDDPTGEAAPRAPDVGADGWHPTPFIPWHQPFYNEAGIYRARVVVPGGQEVACPGAIVAEKKLPDGRRRLDIEAVGIRDFALLCSPRYQRTTGEVPAGPGVPRAIPIEIYAFPEHAHYAREMVRIAAHALATYSRWFGPYPYPKFTIAESYFGWNGNECSTLVMIDERVFGMPHMANAYVEYLVSHEICHQWWYNLIGTNGYAETFLDEALATYFSHRLMNELRGGGHDTLLAYPRGLEWLPNIRREDYRCYSMFGTLGRGENGPVVQDMPKFEHVVNLFSMCYDKGSRILGTIEERIGETAFLDCMRLLYRHYQYRILRVADFQRELEGYTGRSWDPFFKDWIYGKGVTDWAVEKVEVEPPPQCREQGWPARWWRKKKTEATDRSARLPWGVVVWLRQKADITEQTTVGFALPGCEGFPIRVPILPRAKPYKIDDPPATVTNEGPDRVRVEVRLPDEPTQVAVDPDQVLVDREPINNFWKPEVRWRFAPLYTFLDETDLTNAYDRWNVIFGPWFYTATFDNPWYPLSTMLGARLGAYRTQDFSGGLYAAYRYDFRDVVVGVDALWDHWPGDHFQVGLNAEKRLVTLYKGNQDAYRAVGFGRYIFNYGDSLYLPPMHYIENYATYQENFLPFARAQGAPGGERPNSYEAGGLHYRLDYRTPYWDAEGGFLLDLLYEGGVAQLVRNQGMHKFAAEFATVKYLPDLTEWLEGTPRLQETLRPALQWLAETRLAVRAYGAMGLPLRGEWFTLGGDRLVRGFDLAERQGSALWVGSVEWRVPLAKGLTWSACDHIAGLRNIYAAAFYDGGDIVSMGHTLGPVAHSIGAGLRLDVSWFAFVERTMIRLDLAKVVNVEAPVQVWLGVQHPF